MNSSVLSRGQRPCHTSSSLCSNSWEILNHQINCNKMNNGICNNKSNSVRTFPNTRRGFWTMIPMQTNQSQIGTPWNEIDSIKNNLLLDTKMLHQMHLPSINHSHFSSTDPNSRINRMLLAFLRLNHLVIALTRFRESRCNHYSTMEASSI